ncbi:hypothetical protein CANARDRAFT_29536 [[Candida] arabinofermentans NRRL YB-2248]|uniref:Regulator of rDNA transcription 14 n=1 Tax=[Candida] arabinofermentans NRRL YB-2248 TaxID=983967 RepID=A0A1E4SX65_9ASCO|nr:hypothetical protein CANARDRAFT_29536 [[Candida] arabinofermentans NRRL YB-2248]
MSGFQSSQSKAQTESTVNKLLANFLPGSASVITTTSTSAFDLSGQLSSGAAKISQMSKNLKSLRENKHNIAKMKVKEKKLKNSHIRKNIALQSKITKLSKLQTGSKEATQQLVDQNLKSLKSWENGNQTDLKQLQSKVLRMKNSETGKRRKVRASKVKKMEFNARLKKGHISVPGLTPGLAPVGASDDESASESDLDVDSDEDDNIPILKDDYDDYN